LAPGGDKEQNLGYQWQMRYRLVIGNKNISSWSLRPWLAMRQAGIPFEEIISSAPSRQPMPCTHPSQLAFAPTSPI
jgi:hypothetical protein